MKIILLPLVILLLLLNTGVVYGHDKSEIVIETYINNAPFSHLNRDKEIEGFCIDATAAIMDELGREYRYKKTALCQKRIYSDSENLGIMSFVTQSEIIDGWFLSNPYITTQYCIVYREGDILGPHEDIIEKDIVVITGLYSNSHLSTYNAKYIPEVTLLSDVTEGLRLLSSGQVDVAILLQGSQEQLIIDKKFDHLVIDSTVLPVREYCFASKDSMIIKDLNKAIDVLKANKTLDEIYKVWFVETSDKNRENSLLFTIIIIIIIFIVFALMVAKKIRKSVIEANRAKIVMRKYEKTINDFANSYIRIFLTDFKKNEMFILKQEKYTLIENGIAVFIESIHPDDREYYIKEQQNFISDKLTSVTMNIRMLNLEANKYDFYELLLNSVERDSTGKVYEFTIIARNETLQEEMICKQYKDVHNLNMAVKSAKLIRWDIDIVNSMNHIVNIDNKEYVYTNRELIKKIASKDYKQLRNVMNQIKSAEKIDTVTVDIDLFGVGCFKPYEMMITVERNDKGSLTVIYGMLRDMTNVQNNQELLRNELLLNKIISKHVSVGVGFYDKDGVCRSLNTKALELLGFDENKALNTDRLLDFKYISEEAKNELNNGGSVTYQVTWEEIKKRYNKYLLEIDTGLHGELISTNCSSVFNDDKELIGYVSVYTDITEITRTRENILELKTRVEFALDAGAVSAWTYRCADGCYTLLNGYDKVLNIATNHEEVIKTFHPDDIEVMENAIKAIETRQSYKEVFIVRTLINSELATHRLTIIPREQDGEVKHIIGVTKDISEKIKRDLELKDVNNLLAEKNRELNFNITLLKEIIERLPGALFIKDINSNLKYYLANTVFCQKIANKPLDEIIGYYDKDILPEYIVELCRESNSRCIETNSPIELDEEIILDGVKHIWRTIKTPVSLTNDMKLLICMSQDVTDLYLMKEKAEQSDRLKSQFLENMSHEIRTPLNAIVGFSSLLINAEEEETRQEFNDIIMTNSELLLNLINDILDLSKMESGVVSFNDEFFIVNELLEEMYLSFSMMAKQNIELKYEKLDELVNAKIDKTRIRQVLNNYLSNALKFTKSGEVVFGCKVERGGLMLFVKDTGIGIAEENKANVFRRFEKFDSFAQGTGLGLSICKAFADIKQGEVGFDSVLGEGTHFWIWIPCEIKIQSL